MILVSKISLSMMGRTPEVKARQGKREKPVRMRDRGND
jgi:hypothetical protein